MAKFSYTALNFQRVVAVILTFFISTFHVHGVSLDADGYYDIVIAIHEKTAQNSNEKYLDNLKVGVQDLSDALFESTHGKFSIRSADIVLPNHWYTDADAFVTTQTYGNADIRVSHEYDVPQAINPTFCGYPGHHIELPYSFFDERDWAGLYGPTGKALLTLWARFRWGIFEEHGYPGDPIFPYFWKAWAPWDPNEPTEPEPWKVTSCSDTEIKGSYKTPTGEECGDGNGPPEVTENPDVTTSVGTEDPGITTTLEPVNPEDPDDLYPPPSDCRFYPEIYNQSAKSSLMSFPFIQSLTEFCDETTHNPRALNRQNLFCQFKSAWEVIRESSDWKQLNEETEHERRPINFKILKKTDKPLLFILSEGVNKPPDGVISTMTSHLNDIFGKNELWNVLASAGVYPGIDMKDSFDTVYSWNTPWYNKQELVSAFQESFGSRDDTKFRNFGAALQDIGNLIKEKEHSAGAVVVMIKYGSETDYDLRNQWPAYESEVIGTILNENIRLFVLEGEDDQADGDYSVPFRLKNIAELSGGLHFQIGSPSGSEEEDVENVKKVMTEVDAILTSGRVPASKYRLAFKQFGTYRSAGSVNLPLLVNYRNVKGVTFYFHSGTDPFYLDNIRITEGPEGPTHLQLSDYYQWNRFEMQYMTYMAKWSTEDPLKEPSQWTCTFDCYASECLGMIVVIAELADDEQPDQDDIKLDIFTSAENDGNVVNLATETVASLKGVAFSIYAKLEKNGHPINSQDLQVTGHVCHYRDGRVVDGFFTSAVACTEVVLKDSGPMIGDPDLTANDGIFSGNYIPKMEPNPDFEDFRGTHQIFVTASLVKTTVQRSGPLPVKQDHIRCGSGYQGCWTETVTEPFFAHADLKRRIDFTGKEDYTLKEMGAATRVLDLRISQSQFGGYDIAWTEPGVLTENAKWRAESYEIYFADNFEDLLNENFMDKIYDAPPPIEAGRYAKVNINNLEPGQKRWYMMHSVAKQDAAKPIWSNVLFVHATPAFFQTTTTTTTTTTPAPTSSTQRLPTREPVPTTIPTPKTTEAITTTRPTTTQTTTRQSSTATSTTTKPTTEKLVTTTEETKLWYQSTEAIVTFTLFGVGMVVVIGGVLTYMRVTNRD